MQMFKEMILCIFLQSSAYEAEEYPLYGYKTIKESTVSSVVLKDLETHIRPDHPYRDGNLVTWAHETTHGINADLRNTYGGSCYYLLNGQFARIKHRSNKKLSQVANVVPSPLRDHLYNLYLVEQRRDWEDEPYYILDEWVAYSNGCELRNELLMKEDDSEVLNMMKFCVFAGYLSMIDKDPELIEFIRMQTRRSFNIYWRSPGNISGTNQYLAAIRTDPRIESWRINMRSTFGTKWCYTIWGF